MSSQANVVNCRAGTRSSLPWIPCHSENSGRSKDEDYVYYCSQVEILNGRGCVQLRVPPSVLTLYKDLVYAPQRLGTIWWIPWRDR